MFYWFSLLYEGHVRHMRDMQGIGGLVKHRRDIHYWMSMSGIGGICQVYQGTVRYRGICHAYEGNVRHRRDMQGIGGACEA